MTTLLELFGRALASAPALSSPSALVALAGLAGAIALVAVLAEAAVRSVAALAASLRARPVWSRAAEPAVGWLLHSFADPNIDGRPRPRAPGSPLPVA